MQSQMQEKPAKFDLRVHTFDGRGRTKSKSPYRLFIRNGEFLFERPVNSGNLYHENNEAAGRVELKLDERGRIIEKKFELNAQHKTYEAPLSEDEKIVAAFKELQAHNAQLRAELEAIGKEQAQRTGAAPAKPKG